MPIAQSSSKTQSGSAKVTKQQKTSVSEVEEPKTQVASEQPSNTGTKTPPEQPEFIKQTLVIIEKKFRNLDKRRIKLEEYKESARKGATLNEDQLSAVSKYDEVMRTLELTKELEKQFVGLANDTMKQQKKQMKKEQMEKEEQIKEKLKETHRYYSILESFGEETIRSHFVAESLCTEVELTVLDEFAKLVEPCTPGSKLEAASSEFAEHFTSVMDGKNKPIPGLTTTTTYSELKKMFERLLTAPYWTSEPKEQEVVQEQTEQTTSVVVEVVDTTEQTLNQAVENLQLEQEQQQQQIVQQNEQGSYQNVDDYVIVTQSECVESLCHSKSPSLQPGQQEHTYEQMQSKTFFTTLNQPTVGQNINEFISNCENNGEGINFFQDSELSRQQQEQQQQNEMNFQQDNQFSQQTDKDQGFKQRGNQNNRGGPYKGPRNDRPSGERGGPRGPRPNNGYRGGANSGPRGDGPQNGPKGNYRGGQSGPRPNNGHRGAYPQQPRGNFNSDMGQQQSQMA